MGLRVNSNLYSMNAQRHLSNVSERLAGNYSRLSSGLRIASAADDAAGLGISERLRSQVRSLEQAGRNAQDGISLAQASEAVSNETSSSLIRMRELAVQATNGTLNTGDRTVLNTEFQALLSEIDRVATQTSFNGTTLDASSQVSIQVGAESGESITVSISDISKSGLGLSSATFTLTTVTNAGNALNTIDTAIDSLNTMRGSLGAAQNRLQSTFRSISATVEGLAATESRIRDVDVARETADLTRNSILQQASLSILSQANVQPQIALSLLG